MTRKERREGTRHRLSLACRFEHADQVRSGRLKNLSIGGAFLETAHAPEPESSLLLFFEAKGGYQVEISARVAHLRPFRSIQGFGMHFTHFQGESYDKLTELLSGLYPV